MYQPNLKFKALTIPKIIGGTHCGLGLGLRTPNLGEGRPYGVGMVLFERALASSYRPSIVTFHLSPRVSEILLLLCSSTPLSPPHL